MVKSSPDEITRSHAPEIHLGRAWRGLAHKPWLGMINIPSITMVTEGWFMALIVYPFFWWWIWWNGNLKCWLDNFYWMKNLSSSPFCWLNNDFKWLNPRQTTPSSLTQQVPLVPAILGWPTHLSHPWSKKSSFVHTPGCHQTWGNRRMFPLMITSGIFSASCHGWQFCHGFYDATDERVVICSVNYPDKKVTRSPVESGWIRLWNRFHP